MQIDADHFQRMCVALLLALLRPLFKYWNVCILKWRIYKPVYECARQLGLNFFLPEFMYVIKYANDIKGITLDIKILVFVFSL